MAEPADLDSLCTRTRAASRVRELPVCGVLGQLMDLYTHRSMAGREHLDDLTGPAVFVANHQSHMDTPVILRALPGRLRRRTAVGAALLAAEHHLPIVPIYVSGSREAMPRGHHWMVFKAGRPGPRHPIEIRFGKPILPGARERPSGVMARVRSFLPEWGGETERLPQTARARRRQPA